MSYRPMPASRRSALWHRSDSQLARSGAESRRAAAMMLILFMLTTFAITAAITVDYAFMTLVQTELRIATDAAAKAGAEALARGEQVSDAKLAAVNYAALNSVAGEPLRIREADVSVGRLSWKDDGKWKFEEHKSPPNAVRVDSRTGGTSLHPAIPLFFGDVLGVHHFSPQYSSTAGQQDAAVCLCLDRSGSMLLDMSGKEGSFAPNNPYLSDFTAWGETWRNYLSPANPVGSRWVALKGALELFVEEAQRYSPPPRTALVTWGSDYTMPISPYTVYKAATLDVPIGSYADGNRNSNLKAILKHVDDLGTAPIMGGTNLAAGLDKSIAALGTAEAGQFADKYIILMTDGLWNEGRDPLAAAADAQRAGIVVHTVSMLTAHQPILERIAALTGGRHFTTNSENELRQAFRELARSLEVVLVD